jgi:hypothetical protein
MASWRVASPVTTFVHISSWSEKKLREISSLRRFGGGAMVRHAK